ncbi:MAG TPA: DUF1634 domain-containing protein [Bryobacteraceae bacterium]|jgi:uncharacterized membrane protein|nr:DUF1634 domain-containing protein [Bryobacteraceae bacterium]
MTDERLESIVASLLRTGVSLAAAVVLGGGIVYLVRHGGEHPAYSAFHGEPAEYRYVSSIVRAAFSGQARGIIELGLLILIATPVARVVACVAGFALEKDRAYVVITTIVLAILLYSLISKP